MTTPKGRRAITLQMDKARSLKWSFAAIDSFEQLARDELIRLKLIKDTDPVLGEAVIQNFLNQKGLLRIALNCALEDKDVDLDTALNAYMEQGGNLKDLIRALQESYFLAADPSFAASLQKRWQALDGLADLELEKALLESNQKMKDAKQMIKDLSGPQSKGSDSSS